MHGSLWLVIRAFKAKVLDRAIAEGIVNDLIGTGMRLPVPDATALFAYAYETGLLPYEPGVARVIVFAYRA